MVFRLIHHFDIKSSSVVKGVQLEGLQRISEICELSKLTLNESVDEFIFCDVVASLYDSRRDPSELEPMLRGFSLPVTYGGGIDSVALAERLVQNGADKVVVNSAAVRRPDLIGELAETLGRQAVVVGVQAKKLGSSWSVKYESAREDSGREVCSWIREVEALGAGEVLLTSVDRDGTRSGLDIPLIDAVRSVTSLPLIVHGGVATPQDALAAHRSGADGIAVASVFHEDRCSAHEFKRFLLEANVEVRQ